MKQGQTGQTADGDGARETGGGNRWLAVAWRIVRIPLIAYLLVMVVLMFFEESIIFHPLKYPEGVWKVGGFEVEDAYFQAADGTKLHGWYAPRENPRAVVLYCHGNAGNVTNRTEILRRLSQRTGVSVLIFDYRGYGRSEGKPSEAGVLADARAARAWLAQREGIPKDEEAEKIVMMGRSLGGAVAVDLAAADGARALVLESTFTSIPDMGTHIYPWLPVRMFVRTRLDSLSKIGSYEGPLLQSHGDGDSIVPFQLGEKLFQAANEPKEFIPFKGLDHNDYQPIEYYDKLSEFFDQLPD